MRVRTHYDNLKVARDAPAEVIRAAHRALAKTHHPDLNPGSAEAARIMTAVNIAYSILSDPAKRAEHDRWIAQREKETGTPGPQTGSRSEAQQPASTPSPPPRASPTSSPRGAGPGARRKEVPNWMSIGGVVAIALLLVLALTPAAPLQSTASRDSAIPTAGPAALSVAEPATLVATPANAIAASEFIGAVRNDGWPDSPASLRVTFDVKGDGTGSIEIGAPLGGSGRFHARLVGDSVSLSSMSPSGDAIEWSGTRSAGAKERISGRYRILGGAYVGQGGSWTVTRTSIGGLTTASTAAAPCEASPDWADPTGPRSGTERTHPKRHGYGSLKVTNGGGQNAVVLLQPLASPSGTRAMFVHRGESGDFTRVAEGMYRVLFASGTNLNARSWRFCGQTSYSEFDDVVTFGEVRDDNGVSFSRFEVTLHPVVGGTAKRRDIPPSAFEVPEP
jgi:hypothetical protein